MRYFLGKLQDGAAAYMNYTNDFIGSDWIMLEKNPWHSEGNFDASMQGKRLEN